MNFNSKEVLSTRGVTYFKFCAVILLLIGIPSTVFVNSIEIRENDYRDLMLTLQEKQMLDQLKQKVGHKMPETHMKTDSFLLKWIRSAQHDIKKAEKLLLQNLKWREDNQIDKILDEDFSDISSDYILTTNTHDKKDRPIATVNLGTWDIRAAALAGKLPRLYRYSYWYHEMLVKHVWEAQQLGKNVTRAIILVDMDGFNLLQQTCPACVVFQVKLVLSIQSNYPLFWEAFISINTPSIFSMVYNSASGMMTSELKDTMNLIPHDKKRWMEYLDARIDRDQRYTNFGGTRNLMQHDYSHWDSKFEN